MHVQQNNTTAQDSLNPSFPVVRLTYGLVRACVTIALYPDRENLVERFYKREGGLLSSGTNTMSLFLV